MYKPLLKAIPLPIWLKVILCIFVILAFVLLCFEVIFPWAVQFIPYPFGNAGFPENG